MQTDLNMCERKKTIVTAIPCHVRNSLHKLDVLVNPHKWVIRKRKTAMSGHGEYV